jgi:hypothetical protein
MTDRPDYAGIRAQLLDHRRKAEAQIAETEARLTGLRERVRAIDEALDLMPERKRRRAAAVKRAEAAE